MNDIIRFFFTKLFNVFPNNREILYSLLLYLSLVSLYPKVLTSFSNIIGILLGFFVCFVLYSYLRDTQYLHMWNWYIQIHSKTAWVTKYLAKLISKYFYDILIIEKFLWNLDPYTPALNIAEFRRFSWK